MDFDLNRFRARAFGKEKKARSEDAVGNNDNENDSTRPADLEGRKGGRRSKGPKAV